MFKKNTIVLVPFPFTDMSSVKVRPAVILSNNSTSDDVVVAFISSKKVKQIHKIDIQIKEKQKDFEKTGLKISSTIKVDKLATLDKKIVLGELGEVGKNTEKEINKKLKVLFNL